MPRRDLKRFQNLTYADFRRLAGEEGLSRHEKVGFPDSYREGKEDAIFADIVSKLPALETQERTVLDIGAGCSALPQRLIDLCARMRSRLTLVDSPEMLDRLPDAPFVEKAAGHFPDEVSLQGREGGYDVVLIYSVLHYAVAEGGLWPFLDRALTLLSPGGALLLGDIPNVSRRHRFFTSPAGIAFHREFTGDASLPQLTPANEASIIDDALVLEILSHARELGFDAYVVPQAPELPMANRREDVLVLRP
jgi:2-polyprenyl-3-methyl-5-hydroxy-6-metoxy-1,4-benzoquinol methylase